MGEGGARHIGGNTVALIVQHVRAVAGERGVARLLELVDAARPLAELEDLNEWFSYDEAVALFEAAASVTGDAHVGRRIGEETLRQYAGTEVAAMLRALGSPGEVLRNVAQTAGKFSTVTVMEALEIGDDHAVIDSTTTQGIERHQALCDYTVGVLSQAPVLFGMDPAHVVEPECQARGGERCVYWVRWNPASSPDFDPSRRIAYLEHQLEALTSRFEALQATATELVAASDTAEVLAAITRRAGVAVRAPRYLLAVRLRDDGMLRIHSEGFTAEEELRAAAEILADEPDDEGGSRLIVDIASGRHHYGRFAAFHTGGDRFFAAEHELLQSYAGHAAAALEAASALEEARRENRTARALLDLAGSLSEMGTADDVARRLADAIPAVVDSDFVIVFLLDPAHHHLLARGTVGLSSEVADQLARFPIRAEGSERVRQMLATPAPSFLSRDEADQFVGGLMDSIDAVALCVVPIVAHRELFGVITVGVTHRPARLQADIDLLERLLGMASQAATALHNAQLLEQVRYQAMHDSLTGLPNRPLLRDRLDQALRDARRLDEHVAVLFIDLDHFKEVNDSLGHAAGDALLVEMATRLEASLREVDTVARLGGDEFAVVLPHISGEDDAMKVAEKLLRMLRRPVDLEGNAVRISGSVGVAVAEAGDDHDSLLKRADAAMYEAKQRGRDCLVVQTPGT